MFDGEAFGREIVGATKAHVDRAIGPLLARLDALEKRFGELPTPKDGKDADPSAVAALVAGDLRKDIAALQASFDALPRFDAEKAAGEFEAKTAALVAESVQRAVAALPRPQDGKDGAIGAKGEPGDRGEAGPAGRDGRDVDMAAVKAIIKDEVGELFAAHPKPKDGERGPQGESGPAGPQGEKGLPGERGADGKDGAPGRDGEKGEPGERGPQGERGEKGEPGDQGPTGEKGPQGEPGPAGRDGLNGEKGEKGDRGDMGPAGADGRNGLDAVKFLRGDKGQLLVTMSNGDVLELGEIDGKDGKDGIDGKDGAPGQDGRDGIDGEKGLDGKDGVNGKDGADGVGFDDIEESIEDEGRFVVRRFSRNGEVVAEKRHQTVTPIWRGVFDAERTYLPGDMATWKGSVWHCNAEVKGSIGSENWSLAVKKPRDVKPEDVAKFLADRS